MKILCVGGPLDSNWVDSLHNGDTFHVPRLGKPDAEYTKQTVSNKTQVFTIYFHSGDDHRSMLHRLVHGYRG